LTIFYSRKFGNVRVCNGSNICSGNCNVVEIRLCVAVFWRLL